MKSENDVHRLFRKIQIKASAELDGRVHNDISRAAAESEPAIAGPNRRVRIMRIRVVRLSVAAAIILAFGVGFSIGRLSRPTQPAAYSTDVSGYTFAVSAYRADEGGFWQQKILSATRPRPYSQSLFGKADLFKTYRQYLKEKRYD